MKCKSCGGNLVFDKNLFVCDQCHSKYSPHDYFSTSDVYLCYIENDKSGRRTKDSIIAQEIYNEFVQNRIDAFFPRAVNDYIVGEDFENIKAHALSSAKTIIVIGSQKDSFEELVQDYSSVFESKIVIPVFDGVNIADIPKCIGKIQAVDYSKIAAKTDIVQSVLNSLGREPEIDLIKLSNKSNTKKRTIAITIITIVMSLIICVVGYIVFGTTLVLPSKQYNYAIGCLNNGKKIEALEWFEKLAEYKDSKAQIGKIYSSYSGYYIDEKEKLSLHLMIYKNDNVNVEIIKTGDDRKQYRIEESSKFKSDTIELDYLNYEGGKVTIKIDDTKIYLTIVPRNNSIINNIDVEFFVSDKSDQPFSQPIDKEFLMDILEHETTIEDIEEMGYECECVKELTKELGRKVEYRIKDTDIYFVVFDSYTTFDYESSIEFSKPTVLIIMAPIKILYPEKIGKINVPFIDNDYLYSPNTDLEIGGSVFYTFEGIVSQKIQANTMYVVTHKDRIETDYNFAIESIDNYYIDACQTACKKQFFDEYEFLLGSIITQNDTCILIACFDGVFYDPVYYYKFDKITGEVSYIMNIPYDITTDLNEKPEYYYMWQDYPEKFKEFIDYNG